MRLCGRCQRLDGGLDADGIGQRRDLLDVVGFLPSPRSRRPRGVPGDGAAVLLPLCSSIDLAEKQLKELPTGGKTPLAAGLVQGMEILLQERRKNGEVIPMMVVVSDGRANVSLSGDVRREVLDIAEEIRSQGIRMVVIDTEETGNSFVQFQLGYCRPLAEHAGGGYYPIADLSAGVLHDVAAAERDAMVRPA